MQSISHYQPYEVTISLDNNEVMNDKSPEKGNQSRYEERQSTMLQSPADFAEDKNKDDQGEKVDARKSKEFNDKLGIHMIIESQELDHQSTHPPNTSRSKESKNKSMIPDKTTLNSRKFSREGD